MQETGTSSLQTKMKEKNKKESGALSQGKNKIFVEYIPSA